MAGILLALFPVLLLFNSRLAWLELAVAVIMLYLKRVNAARRPARPRIPDDAY